MSEAMVTMNIRIEESQRDDIDHAMAEANKIVDSAIRCNVLPERSHSVSREFIWQNRSQFLRWVIDVGLETIRNKHAASGWLADRSDA